MRETTTRNRILQIIPATPEWRAAFWQDDATVLTTPVACWALVEHWRGNIRDDLSWQVARPPFDRTVEALIEGDCGLHEAADVSNFLGLIPPGESVPGIYMDEAKRLSEELAARKSGGSNTK
jgi:hypothetical protein